MVQSAVRPRTLEIERTRICRVGILRGHRVGLAVLVGAGVGALALGTASAIALPLETTDRPAAFAGGAAFGGVFGGLAGALVGSQIGRYDWYDAGVAGCR